MEEDFLIQAQIDGQCRKRNPKTKTRSLGYVLSLNFLHKITYSCSSRTSLHHASFLLRLHSLITNTTSIVIAPMRRVATDDIQLSDGTVIRKGAMIAVSARNQRDPAIYKNPDQWDGYRFFNLRETPGMEHVGQLVSTSPDHLGFGHGVHACPGRFFAANEIKILLCHLLLRYDIKLAPGSQPQSRASGFHINSDPLAKVSIRRRQDVDLSVLQT